MTTLLIKDNHDLLQWDAFWDTVPNQASDPSFFNNGTYYQSNALGAQFMLSFRGTGFAIHGRSVPGIGGILRLNLLGGRTLQTFINFGESGHENATRPMYTVKGLAPMEYQLIGTVVDGFNMQQDWLSGSREGGGWVWIESFELTNTADSNFLPQDCTPVATSVNSSAIIVDNSSSQLEFDTSALTLDSTSGIDSIGINYQQSVTTLLFPQTEVKLKFRGSGVWWFGRYGPDAAPVDVILRSIRLLDVNQPFTSTQEYDDDTMTTPSISNPQFTPSQSPAVPDGTIYPDGPSSIITSRSTTIVTRTSFSTSVQTVTETVTSLLSGPSGEVTFFDHVQAYSAFNWYQKKIWGTDLLLFGDWELTLRHVGVENQALEVDFFRVLELPGPIAQPSFLDDFRIGRITPRNLALIASSTVAVTILVLFLSICVTMQMLWKSRPLTSRRSKPSTAVPSAPSEGGQEVTSNASLLR